MNFETMKHELEHLNIGNIDSTERPRAAIEKAWTVAEIDGITLGGVV